MSQAVSVSASTYVTVADLLSSMGDIPSQRVRLDPPPGRATEQDVVRIHDCDDRLCELIDGVLVEKTVGAYESYLAELIGYYLNANVLPNNLGIVLGADGLLRLAPGHVRIPDVAFIGWAQLPGRQFPAGLIADLHPDLAVEVLSAGNTRREMDRKLRDYFQAGTRLVWYLDPPSLQMRVYTSPSDVQTVEASQILNGGDVLPGFSMPLSHLFRVRQQDVPGAS